MRLCLAWTMTVLVIQGCLTVSAAARLSRATAAPRNLLVSVAIRYTPPHCLLAFSTPAKPEPVKFFMLSYTPPCAGFLSSD